METPTIELTGNWDLTIDFQGQQIPVSLTLEQTDGTISGKLESMLGMGKIENGKVAGNSLSAVAVLETQGQAFEILINGSVENEEITGTLSGPQLPHTYNFSGHKK